MTITDPLVLPPDVALVPVASLSPEVRSRLECPDDGYAMTRPNSRARSTVIDADSAALLKEFHSPTTIVGAVIAYSDERGLDPRETLERCFPLLRELLDAGMLVSPDSELARPIESSIGIGEMVGGFSVVDLIQILIDTEVYLARGPDRTDVALKVARPGVTREMNERLAHEARVLTRLAGRFSPRLLKFGRIEDRPFLALSWCMGTDIEEAARQLRDEGGREDRAELVLLCRGLVETYEGIHGLGFLHGDVHPRNTLVEGTGEITLVDFGLAQPLDGPPVVGRGGADLFVEPELARARIEGGRIPGLTPASEQYSVAALAYHLLTGSYTHRFSLDEEAMLRQVANKPVLSFSEHGIQGFPSTEQVLGRALSKSPAARFATMAHLAAAFRSAASSDGRQLRGKSPRTKLQRVRGPLKDLLTDVLSRLNATGPLLSGTIEAPIASFNNGAAGFGYALMRIAMLREDERLLALANVWTNRAVQAALSGTELAFWNRDLDITPEVFGKRSLYHTESGIQCVASLLAGCRGDDVTAQEAIGAFVAANGGSWPKVDVSFGCAGNLIGCSVILDSLAPTSPARAAVISLGNQLTARLVNEVELMPPIGDPSGLTKLGAAHGWAGILYALLRWSESSSAVRPDWFEERLSEFSAQATPIGRGLRWPHEVGLPPNADSMRASWCNGAAGIVHLWAAASRILGSSEYLSLAERAAWTAYESSDEAADLCCGLAGRAYALLELAKSEGRTVWIQRARGLADHAAQNIRLRALRRDSLYKGEVGVALLSAELDEPQSAMMPLYR